MKDQYTISIEKRLAEFLTQDQRRSLFLKGKWGVGKTYFWRSFIKTFLLGEKKGARGFLKQIKFFFQGGTDDSVGRDYVYVSLFGIGTSNELKRNIMSAVGGPKGLLGKVSGSVEKVSLFGLTTSTSPSFGWYFRKHIQNLIICFDDVERKHPNLSMEEVLGLIDILKSENECHCVIILNEEELQESDRFILNKYRDKIIDIELHFNPLFERNFSIIFSPLESNCDRQTIYDVCKKLSCCNIRTIQRISWILKDFSLYLNEMGNYYRQEFIRQLAILTVIHYDHSDCVSLADLRGVNWVVLAMENRKESQKPHKDEVLDKEAMRKSRLLEIVASVEFSPHDLDEVICSYLNYGFIDEVSTKPIFDAWTTNLDLRKLYAKREELRQMVWGGFGVTEADVISRMNSFLVSESKWLSADEYDDWVKLVSKFDTKFDRESLDVRYIEARIGLASLQEITRLEELASNEITKQIIEARRKELLRSEPLEVVINRICASDCWNANDYILLNAFSYEELADFFNLVLNQNSVREMTILAKRLGHGRMEDEVKIAKKLYRIAMELSGRSALDQNRAERAIVLLSEFLKNASAH